MVKLRQALGEGATSADSWWQPLPQGVPHVGRNQMHPLAQSRVVWSPLLQGASNLSHLQPGSILIPRPTKLFPYQQKLLLKRQHYCTTILVLRHFCILYSVYYYGFDLFFQYFCLLISSFSGIKNICDAHEFLNYSCFMASSNRSFYLHRPSSGISVMLMNPWTIPVSWLSNMSFYLHRPSVTTGASLPWGGPNNLTLGQPRAFHSGAKPISTITVASQNQVQPRVHLLAHTSILNPNQTSFPSRCRRTQFAISFPPGQRVRD